MSPRPPYWGWFDLSEVFDYLFDFLKAIWAWSDVNGIILYGTYISFREMIVAGLLVSVLISRLLGSYDAEVDAGINDTYEKLHGRYSDD